MSTLDVTHYKFDSVLISYGYQINEADKCIYTNEDNVGVIICLYVDALLIFGTNLEIVNDTKSFLSSNFYMKDMSEVDVILGNKIIRDFDRIMLS